MNDTQIQLYTRAADREQAVALIEAATVLLDKGEKYQTIATDADAAVLGEFRARANKHATDLENERLDMGKGLRDTLAGLNEEFNRPIFALRGIVTRADSMLREYLNRKREAAEAEARRIIREQREAQERADAEQRRLEKEAKKAGEPPPPAPAPVAIVAPSPVASPEIQGTFGSKIRTAEKWRYRIKDIAKVPERFLVPVEDRVNKSVLNAMAKSMKAEAKVPGIEFYDEGRIDSRVTT